MFKRTTAYCLSLIFLVFSGCSVRKQKQVQFKILHAYNHTAYLEAIPYEDEKGGIIDSANIKSGKETIVFEIPEAEERAYKLSVSGSRVEIVFIDDEPVVTVNANIINPSAYIINNSPASNSVKDLLQRQENAAGELRNEAENIDSLKTSHSSQQNIYDLQKQYESGMTIFFKRFTDYADTVSSPGAFLYIYNHIDFGKDFSGLKKFIERAGKRFPGHSQIRKLKENTLAYLKIFEEDYHVGQKLPDISLPDRNGMPFSTATLRGKYVFLDFWSTWCEACLQYDQQKSLAYREFAPAHFQLVSIALDPEKDNWLYYINSKKFEWPQLIDEKLWKGDAVKTFKIDSIPYNFILDPQGTIVDRAIPVDSVLVRLRRIIK